MTKKTRVTRRQDALDWLDRATAAVGEERSRFLRFARVATVVAKIHEERGDVDDRRGRPKGSKGANLDNSAADAFMDELHAIDPTLSPGDLARAAVANGHGVRANTQQESAVKRLRDRWRDRHREK